MVNDQSTTARQPADPIGQRGLPATREALDELVTLLCMRLRTARTDGLRGKQLAAELGLRDTRALRLLVAYARVYKHIHQIIGLHGDGYFWGDAVENRKRYKRAIGQCERMGRCQFFTAALLKREGTAMAAAQAVFDWFEAEIPPDARRNDDLAALIAAEGVDVSDVLDAIITRLAATESGKAALAKVGAKHARVLIEGRILRELADKCDALKADILAAESRSA